MTQHQQIEEFEAAISRYDAPAGTQVPLAFEGGEAAPTSRAKSAAPQAKNARSILKRFLIVGVAVAALGGAGYLGHDYWTFGRFAVSTDDAYVKADNTTIAPKVAGYVASVLVGDNERVKAGQILARIDDRDFKVAVEQAKADVEAARAAIGTRQAAIVAQQSAIDGASAAVAADEANQTFAEQENKRYAGLAATGFGSVQNAQQASSRVLAARANGARGRAALVNATRQLDVLKAELAQAEANLARAQAAQDQAELNLSYTAILSPADGQIANRTLRVGQYVQAGTQLMAVVPVEGSYIVANYKETQLTEVHAGQPVEIEVDMFPGQLFKGRVDSVAPASGQEFAVLPPDNATGNFTKVVQRIPVKIVLDAGSPLAAQLRPGMSVTPTIDTRVSTPLVATVANARS
jgi:membrane fusion protein (multidrug efflux system)